MGAYITIEEIFDAIADMNYVVLRNYEEFDDLQFLLDHPDIDILCDDRTLLAERLSLRPRGKKDDRIHYFVMLNEKKISVDLRGVGDGYFDAAWERRVLRERIKYQNFYVMDAENYFYSLLYHVIVQKRAVTSDYAERLGKMAEQLGVSFSLEGKEAILDAYMEQNGYRYTYPEFAGTIFNVARVRKDLIEKNRTMHMKRRFYAVKKYLRNVIKR